MVAEVGMRSGFTEISHLALEHFSQTAGEEVRIGPPLPSRRRRSPHPSSSSDTQRWKAVISNRLKPSLKNTKHVQLALVQKRKQQQKKNILVPWVFPSPPNKAVRATSAPPPSARGSQAVSLGFPWRTEKGRQQFEAEGEEEGAALPSALPGGQQGPGAQPLLSGWCPGGGQGQNPAAAWLSLNKPQ